MSIASLWNSYVSSNLNLPKDDSRFRQVYLINTLSLVMITALTFYIFFNLFVSKLYVLAFVEMVVLFAAFIPIIILRKLQNVNLAATLVTINLFLLMVFFIYDNGHKDYALAQAVFLPVMAIFLKGKRFGLLYSLLFISIILYIAFHGLNVWEPAPFTVTSFTNLISLYLVVIVMVYFFESSRKEAFTFIKKASDREHKNNLKLHEKTILLNRANEELNLYKTDLEAQVEKILAEKQAQEEILKQQSKMAAMGEMISSIAHQWKQPLAATASIVNTIKVSEQFNDVPNQNYLDQMAKIEKQLDFMNETITDFSNFFKPHKVSEIFNLSSLLTSVNKLLSAQFAESKIELKTDFENENITLKSFKNELSQVLINILNNAKDAINEKLDAKLLVEGSGWVEVKMFKKDDAIIITIEDNAGGIPATVLPNIFTPYFTTKSAEKGTGIGLYMSQNIVEQSLNGDISVTNGENGAIFTITL
jgi:signal transduction histidine kinase